MKSDFETISQKWSPYWDDVSRATFGSLPWRSRSQHDLASKSCSAHNFVFWSRIWNYFTEMITILRPHVGHQLGCFLEGQGHSMTLHQNRVRPITLLFEVGFWNYFTEMITILRRRVTHNIWVVTLQQDRVRSITLLFDVGFYNYFWQTFSLCPIPIRGALPGSDRLLLNLLSFAPNSDSSRALARSWHDRVHFVEV